MVPYYRRPPSAMIHSLIDVGFIPERLLEPQALVEFKNRDPGNYEKPMPQPGIAQMTVSISGAAGLQWMGGRH